MSLVDELCSEFAESFGLRAQKEWQPAVESALSTHSSVQRFEGANTLDTGWRARVLSDVARQVTVPETHFFRNHAQLAFCAEHAAKMSKKEGRRADLWCAGSATGEEPYTVAMLLAHAGHESVSAAVDIQANDINPDAIEKARAARYTSWSFRGAPSWCFSYFQADGPGQLALAAPSVKNAVSFEVASCQSWLKRRRDHSVDAILFRNVAIYMDAKHLQDLYREMARVLRPSGVLAIGPSDPRPEGLEFSFHDYFDDAPIFVQKSPERAAKGLALLPRTLTPLPPRDRNRGERKKSLTRATEEPRPTHSPKSEAPSSFRVVVELTRSAPEDSVAHLILGQMHLECGEADKAVTVLRRAVFLDGEDVLARYFYALALQETSDTRGALRQLENVLSDLVLRPSDSLLTDQSTEARELLASARFLEEQWRR